MKTQNGFTLLNKNEIASYLAKQKVTRKMTRLQVHHMDLPSGDNVGNAERVQSFNQEFGKHYLNIREYICKYGIVIANELGANITVSNSDQELINKGQIPGCLRIDGVHGNYWYYQIVARAVFEKGQDLGYW